MVGRSLVRGMVAVAVAASAALFSLPRLTAQAGGVVNPALYSAL
jgi:hypothetical protein